MATGRVDLVAIVYLMWAWKEQQQQQRRTSVCVYDWSRDIQKDVLLKPFDVNIFGRRCIVCLVPADIFSK